MGFLHFKQFTWGISALFYDISGWWYMINLTIVYSILCIHILYYGFVYDNDASLFPDTAPVLNILAQGFVPIVFLDGCMNCQVDASVHLMILDIRYLWKHYTCVRKRHLPLKDIHLAYFFQKPISNNGYPLSTIFLATQPENISQPYKPLSPGKPQMVEYRLINPHDFPSRIPPFQWLNKNGGDPQPTYKQVLGPDPPSMGRTVPSPPPGVLHSMKLAYPLWKGSWENEFPFPG